jgi:hypothetical protein
MQQPECAGQRAGEAHGLRGQTQPPPAFKGTLPELKITVQVSSPPLLHLAESLRSPKRIALVYADELFHQSVREALRLAAPRWALEHHSSLEQGIAAIKNMPPAAVIVDHKPNPFAIHCIDTLSSTTPRTPVLVVTSKTDTAQIIMSFRAGASGYLIVVHN